MRLLPALTLALLVPALTAQGVGRHDFDVDTNQSGLTFGGNVTLLGISAPLNGNPATFTPSGSASADLGVSGAGLTSISIVNGDETIVTVPTLNAVVPNPIFFLPPIATVQVQGLTLEFRSENIVGSALTAPVGPSGSFTTEVLAETLSGVGTITGTVNQTVPLTGIVSTPQVVGGTLVRTASGVRLTISLNLSFQFTDPASGASGTINLNGNLVANDRRLAADKLAFPAAAGGTQNFRLSAGSQFGNRIYVLLGSASGTSPGTNFGGVNLPLNVDGLTELSIASANMFPYGNSNAFLDANGFANASFSLPAIPSLQGLSFDHAYAILNGSTVLAASNAVPLQLL